MIIERSIALRYRLQLIVEIKNDLGQWHLERKFNTIGSEVILILDDTTLIHTQADYGSDEVGLRNDLCADKWFEDIVDRSWIGHFGRSVDEHFLSIRKLRLELHRWYRGDNGHIELALETFLDDLHMKHTEEPAAETESQCSRCLRFPNQ